MRTKLYFLSLLALLVFQSNLPAGVMDPSDRQKKIAAMETLLERNVLLPQEASMAALGNPFTYSPAEKLAEKKVEEVKATISSAELLEILSGYVQPTGIVALGGEYFLILQERRKRIGDDIVVNYQKKDYAIRVDSVIRNGFTLKLGNSEKRIKLK